MAKSVKLWFGRLHDSSEAQRRRAQRTLADLSPADSKAVPELLEYLRSDDPAYRYWAARGLSGIGPNAADAVPALIETLEDHNDDCRFWAVEALSSIGPEARSAIPSLINHLRDTEFGIRQVVADALSRIAPIDPEVVPALVSALASDEKEFVRQDIVRALGNIGTPEAIIVLMESLSDTSSDIRLWAAIGLKMLGPKAKVAKERLQGLLTSEVVAEVRSQAETALQLIETEDEDLP